MANTLNAKTDVWVCTEAEELTTEGVTVVWVYYAPASTGNTVTITDGNDELAFFLASQASFKRAEQTPYFYPGRRFNGLKISQISGGTVYIHLKNS